MGFNIRFQVRKRRLRQSKLARLIAYPFVAERRHLDNFNTVMAGPDGVGTIQDPDNDRLIRYAPKRATVISEKCCDIRALAPIEEPSGQTIMLAECKKERIVTAEFRWNLLTFEAFLEQLKELISNLQSCGLRLLHEHPVESSF